MKMTPGLVETLDLLDEENHEIGVARSKLRRTGPDYQPFNDPTLEPYRPGEPTNMEAYKVEVMDALTLIGLLIERGLFTTAEFDAHRDAKLEKLRRWAPGIFEE